MPFASRSWRGSASSCFSFFVPCFITLSFCATLFESLYSSIHLCSPIIETYLAASFLMDKVGRALATWMGLRQEFAIYEWKKVKNY